MISPNRRQRVRRGLRKTIGLNLGGRPEPEVYRVSEDVYRIVEKMLDVNHAIGPFSSRPRFEFAEVQFILHFLGAPIDAAAGAESSMVDLWISEG